jgi:hypothetical protein
MRFTFVLSGLFAVLAAAESSGSATVAAPASSVSLDPAQQSQYACIKACAAGDVNCQAHCIAVPSPNQSQVNATTQCVAKCPQGDGSPAQTNAYKVCIDGCINQHYFVTSEGTPEPTGASGGKDNSPSGTGSDTAAAPTGSSGSNASGSGSGSPTKSGGSTKTGSAATQSTTNAAPAIIASGGALAGVIAALLAL